MTVQWSAAVRNAVVDAWEAAIGASPKIEIRTSAQPAGTISAPSGSVLAVFPLAADWAANAAAGVKSLSSLPATVVATGAGVAGHYRITDSAGTVCHEQGSVTSTGGGGDLTVDNPSIAAGQSVQITAWSKTAPGA